MFIFLKETLNLKTMEALLGEKYQETTTAMLKAWFALLLLQAIHHISKNLIQLLRKSCPSPKAIGQCFL